jgi:Leucine-rich repeat (LRR) protein
MERNNLNEEEKMALVDLESSLGSRLKIVEDIKKIEDHWGGCLVTKRNFGYTIKENHIVGLGLHNLRLKSLPDSISDLKFLEKLELGCNILRTIPENIGKLDNLTELHLVRNQLQSLPKSIGNLTSLTILNVGDNNLSSLPNSIGDLHNLVDLKLFSNEISQLPESIGNLKNLKSLNLYANRLKILPESMGNLNQLKSLRLSSNFLKNLPESFGNLSSLEILHLRQNLLEYLPESFGDLRSLTYLNLWKNSLEALPESFARLTNLSKLEMRGNEDLKHNLILLKRLPKLTEYHLDENILKSDPISLSSLDKREIGAFEVITGEISVIDPWVGGDPQLTIHVPKGKWFAYYLHSFDSPSQINSLLAVHERFVDRYIFPDDWLEGHLRIESKQCGIYDNFILPDSNEEKYDLFYNENEIITTDNTIGLFGNYGVVSSAPENDLYPVFSLPNDRGFIVAVWIVFKKTKNIDKYIKF